MHQAHLGEDERPGGVLGCGRSKDEGACPEGPACPLDFTTPHIPLWTPIWPAGGSAGSPKANRGAASTVGVPEVWGKLQFLNSRS